MSDLRPSADHHRAGERLAAATGVAVGAVLGALLGAALRIAAAVAQGAFGRHGRPPAANQPPGLPRPGWNTAQPQHLLKPTYWPMVLALAITFITWGLTSKLMVTYVGVAFFVLALINWTGLLRHGE